jgi:hypothetical protein
MGRFGPMSASDGSQPGTSSKCATPVQSSAPSLVAGVFRVCVEIDIDESGPPAGRVRSGDRAQLDRAVAAEDEHVFLR